MRCNATEAHGSKAPTPSGLGEGKLPTKITTAHMATSSCREDATMEDLPCQISPFTEIFLGGLIFTGKTVFLSEERVHIGDTKALGAKFIVSRHPEGDKYAQEPEQFTMRTVEP